MSRRTLVVRLVGLLALASFLTPPLGAQEKKPLKWAADEEGGAPYIFKSGKELDRVGFEVDIVKALERELKRPIEFQPYDFQNLLPGLIKGDFDFAMNGIEVLPERREKVLFSRPYYIYSQQLVVRAKDNRFDSFKKILESPTNVIVGTMEATAALRILEEHVKHGSKIEPKVYAGPVEAYQDLALERTDAVLIDLPMAVYYAKHNPELKFAGTPFAKGLYAIAFRKTDTELAKQFDEAIGRLLQSGELRDILRKWGIWNDAQFELYQMPDSSRNPIEFGDEETPDIIGESQQTWTFSVFFPPLLHGAWITVKLSFVAFALAVTLGLIVATARLYGPTWLRWLAVGYVEFFRGIPVLLLLFFLYFGLPALSSQYLPFSIQLDPFWAAVIGLGLNYAAYEAEIYRAGITSVPAGQWEAAASLGMSSRLTFRRIILPQAVRTILPPMTGDFVALFKETSIASMITLMELNKEFQILSRSSMMFVEIGLTTAALYLVMAVPLGYLSRYLEQRWSHGMA
jgi:polar amino acid transport system substrate-binding protein